MIAALVVAAMTIHGYGLSLDLPAGWTGRVFHGEVVAHSRGARIDLREWQPSPLDTYTGNFKRLAAPPQLQPQLPPQPQHRTFALHGRFFIMFAQVSKTQLAAANRVLASFKVRKGDFYKESVEPARFRRRPSWRIGTSGSSKLLAQGAQTETWASTVRYRDPILQLPPRRTLVHLPRDGVVIHVDLSRSWPTLKEHTQGGWRIDSRQISTNVEGQPQQNGLYRAYIVRPRYNVDIWVYFGVPHPSRRVIARAQAELNAVSLPRWPRG